MNIIDWIPAITSTSVFAGLLWFFRTTLSTLITKSVESKFDAKLEGLRSQLREKENQIEALRSGALSGLISRQSILYNKQIEAVEQVWDGMTELAKAKFISATIATLKFEASSEEAANNPKFRQIFEVMGGGFDLKSINLSLASKARPFLSPMAWAYYSAYQSIIMLDALKFETLRMGVGAVEKYFDTKKTTSLLKTVLPHQSEYLDKYGPSAHHYLLDEIEQLLLSELKKIQKGEESDKENTERAAEILKQADELRNSISEDISKA